MSATTHRPILLSYEVTSRDDWELPEEQVPESQPHDHKSELIRDLLTHWVARTGLDAQVARNLAVRWDPEHWRVGVDPDVCLIVPKTPERDELESLLTWKEGHAPPRIAFEIVSTNATKDYEAAPEKYAVSGTFELVIFDEALRGPRVRGGPHRIQVWRRTDEGGFERMAAGDGPFFLEALHAWVFAVDEGRRLRFADDREGTQWWTTAEEAERTAKEAALVDVQHERAEKERERAEKERALARIAELEAEMRRR
ncbi:MAG: Uma2 family endonuclease [Polyangiales bacterium]